MPTIRVRRALPRARIALLPVALLLASWTAPARAAVVASWTPPNTDVDETNFPATSSLVSASAMTDFGAPLANVVIAGSYAVKMWPVTMNMSDYIEFSVTGNVTFQSVVFSWWSSSSHVNSVAIRSSADGYTSSLSTATHPQDGQMHQTTLDVSSLGTQTGTTTFRLYFWGGTSATPTAFIDGPSLDVGAVGLEIIGSASCSADEHVVSHACVACPAGSTNPPGDDPSGADTSCSDTLCAADQHVVSHACVACAAGTTRPAGDDATGADTSCTDIICATGQHVVSHACVACAPGSTRAAGDNATGADTSCTDTLCATDEHVVSHACVACPAGQTNPAGDNATGTDTSCTPSPDAGTDSGAGGSDAGTDGSAGAAGNDAGTDGSAGAAGSDAGTDGSAGAAGSDAGIDGSAGAGGAAGADGSASGGTGGTAGAAASGGTGGMFADAGNDASGGTGGGYGADAGPDAGAARRSIYGAGCGCTVVGSRGGSTGWSLLFGLGIALGLRRRRRR